MYLVRLILSNKTINLGTTTLKDRPGSSDLKKLAFVSEAVSANKGGNLIYSNGSAQAEKLDETAYEGYINLVGTIGKTISNYPPQLNSSRAILLINWMRGRPLSYLISSSYNSYQANEKFRDFKSLPIVIRETMDNVENFVGFRFAKSSSCYVNVLQYFLELNKKQDLISRIPELSLWLEFGVSQKTHLSLLSLGLSRSTVIELSEFITNSQMTKEECLQWIRDSNFELLELSPIIKEDIRKVI